jgi:hypothetical protein
LPKKLHLDINREDEKCSQVQLLYIVVLLEGQDDLAEEIETVEDNQQAAMLCLGPVKRQISVVK